MIYQDVLDRTDHVSTENMTQEEWLEKRRSFIGGSDAGAVMELSNYGSKLTVYLEKKGKAKIEENDAMLRGSIMEPYIRELTQKEFPYMKFEEAPFIFQSKENPYMGANVDGFVSIDLEKYIESNRDDEIYELLKTKDDANYLDLGIHEIKTSQDGYGFGVNEIPDGYFAQVQHYLYVTSLPWAILTVYIISKNKIQHYPIKRNEEFIANMIAVEKSFWENYFLKDEMPAAIGLPSEEDMITGMFTGSDSLLLDDKEKDICGEYVMINRQIKELEAKKQSLKVNLMQSIVEKSQGDPAERKVSAYAGSYSVSWTTVERKDVDRDALKKDGLFEKYQKVSTYDRFTVTEKKG